MEAKNQVEKVKAGVRVELEIEELESKVAPEVPSIRLSANHNETFQLD